MKLKLMSFAALALSLSILGCGKKTSGNDIEEVAQQIGDVMASIDESSGSNIGQLTMLEDSHLRTFSRFGDGLKRPTLIDTSNASYCSFASTFGSCSSGTLVRNFGGCSIGYATVSGTVTLNWSNGSTCAMAATGQSVSRSPNFTLTGLRGATLAVTKTGSFGQRLTWSSGTAPNRVFSFINDGIKRTFTTSSGEILFDFTTTTGSPITVTGDVRSSSRSMSGGSLHVVNNVSGVSCDFVPSAVTWSSNCNCAVSGSWTATCSDGKSSSLTLTGCGSGNFTLGSDSTAVSFDRCYGT